MTVLLLLILLIILIGLADYIFRSRSYLTHTFKTNNQNDRRNEIMLEFQNDQKVVTATGIKDDDGQIVPMTDFTVVSNDESVVTVSDVTQLEDGRMQYEVIGVQGVVGATSVVETATTADGQIIVEEYAVSTLPNPVAFSREISEPINQ